MEIERSGTQDSQKGPAEHFAGSGRIDPLFQPNGVQRALGAYVTFEPKVSSGSRRSPTSNTE